MITPEHPNLPPDQPASEKEKPAPHREISLPLVANIKNLLQAHIELPLIIIKSVSETFRIIRHAKSHPLTPEERIDLFRRLYPVVTRIYEQLQFNQLNIELVNHDDIWRIDVYPTSPSWLRLTGENSESNPYETSGFLEDGEFVSFDLNDPTQIQTALMQLQDLQFKRKTTLNSQ